MKKPEQSEDEIPVVSQTRRLSVCSDSIDPTDAVDFPHVIHKKTPQQFQKLLIVCRKVLLFQDLDPIQLNIIVDAMFMITVKSGDRIIKQGLDGDYFYIIETGKYEAAIISVDGSSKIVASYGPSDTFGELALLYNVPRAATVKALTNGVVWALDRTTFKNIVVRSAHRRRELFKNLFSTVPALQMLEQNDILRISDTFCVKQYTNGDTIIGKGAPPNGIFFALGSSSIKLIEDREPVIMSLKFGDYFGEVAVINKTRTLVTVISNDITNFALFPTKYLHLLPAPCFEVFKSNMSKKSKTNSVEPYV